MPFWTGRRAIGGILLLVVLIALTWAAVVVAVAVHAAHDEATGADAIVVLGAAQYNGRPSPVFRARLDHAAALYQRGLAPTVLVTGGVGAHDTLNEADVGREYLLRLGIPDNVVLPLRSEEHTSELQSRLHLVCRLLLEKKKKKNTIAIRLRCSATDRIARSRSTRLMGSRVR